MNQRDAAWARRTAHLDNFAAPWTSKPNVRAYAYPTATTFADALAGFKGKRKSVMFHMAHGSEADAEPCTFCEGPLGEPARAVSRDMGNGVRTEAPAAKTVDRSSTWYYVPGQGIAGGMHYQCSWANLLGRISTIRFAA